MMHVQTQSGEVPSSESAIQPEFETTRVFVSGLPPKFTSDQLASHFGTAYKVTDAHVIADRRIGFVGFVDSGTARHAAAHFNKSYIRMSKIAVDLARPVQVTHDRQGQAVPISEKRQVTGFNDTNRKRKRAREDDGEEQRANLGEPKNSKNETINSLPQQDETVPEPQLATDSDWLRGRTTRTLDLVDADDVHVLQDNDQGDEPRKQEPPNQSRGDSNEQHHTFPVTVKVPNARLFLRNLAFSVTDADLQQHFEPFGKVQEIHLVKDAKNSISKGTAFVQFSQPHEAEAALQASDGTTFQGRLLHMLPASDKRDKGLTEYEISQMPLKKQKAIRRRLEASKQNFSWNSLYMNPDAVMSSIADRLGVDKADILDPTSSDAAVKQAHAETQLIKETKQYLASVGVDTDAFKNKGRDPRCLLLKNFPYGTTEGDLRALLDSYGTISKFLLPPAGTMALVQFDQPVSASQALKGLAYKNVKGSVLYLEKAPQGILSVSIEAPNNESTVDPVRTGTGPTTTIFVKNLNFSTTTARLNDTAKDLPGFISARVKTKTDAKRPGQVLSMGFGFLEFQTKEQAQSAVKGLAGHRLDGHELAVQLSSRGTDAAEETRTRDRRGKRNANQTKIVIKNLPFQVSKKDIRSLFAQYGELKMVRVPRKFDNTARGFAFAEFVTPKEAENAMEALTNTHLLGRRLVIDFAEGEDVDPEEEIRAIERKVEQQSNRVHFNTLKGPGRKKFNLESAQENDLTT